jgi:hypothetical protein
MLQGKVRRLQHLSPSEAQSPSTVSNTGPLECWQEDGGTVVFYSILRMLILDPREAQLRPESNAMETRLPMIKQLPIRKDCRAVLEVLSSQVRNVAQKKARSRMPFPPGSGCNRRRCGITQKYRCAGGLAMTVDVDLQHPRHRTRSADDTGRLTSMWDQSSLCTWIGLRLELAELRFQLLKSKRRLIYRESGMLSWPRMHVKSAPKPDDFRCLQVLKVSVHSSRSPGPVPTSSFQPRMQSRL